MAAATTAEPSLQGAREADLPCLLDFVRAAHRFEGVERSDAEREAALRPLLGANGPGRVFLLRVGPATVGYVALTFGYSIEFGGRDAFIDELFIAEGHRGRGIGGRVLQQLRGEAAALGIHALHLEVDRENRRAQRLYRSAGFDARTRYFLMSARLDTDSDHAEDGPA